MTTLAIDSTLTRLCMEDGVAFYHATTLGDGAFVVFARDEVDHTCLGIYEFTDVAHWEAIYTNYDIFTTFGL